jgi:hypothetical protein
MKTIVDKFRTKLADVKKESKLTAALAKILLCSYYYFIFKINFSFLDINKRNSGIEKNEV